MDGLVSLVLLCYTALYFRAAFSFERSIDRYMDQNNKNNKPGGGKNNGSGNWRGFVHLICWALLLTAVVGYAGNYMTSTAHRASSVELEYSAFRELVEIGRASCRERV